jgi:hypothetical protein
MATETGTKPEKESKLSESQISWAPISASGRVLDTRANLLAASPPIEELLAFLAIIVRPCARMVEISIVVGIQIGKNLLSERLGMIQ